MKRTVFVVVTALVCSSVPAVALAAPGVEYLPGAPGVGDPYFPLDGNGGYDVQHYDLGLTYDPETDVLTGLATIHARATQNLSSFNLDFVGLRVRSITVNGAPATWSRDGGELTITPSEGIRDRRRIETVIAYDGVPQTIDDPAFGPSGFIHTDDGALVVGQPDVAAMWFPANDHPSDKASFTFDITAPTGLEVVSNGVLKGQHDHDGWTSWTWDAREPMAPYLAMMTIGEYALSSYKQRGIAYWDAIDVDLLERTAPRTGEQFALSQTGDATYKRLARTISVPAGGAQLSFWISRDTEQAWDFTFVEAHTVGQDDWTTLEDVNGHNNQGTGFVCPGWLDALHPFLTHYQTDNGDGSCSPSGATGEWWAISGASDGYEQWTVDLSAYAGTDVEVSISYASDEIIQGTGAFVDDITVTTGEGSTSFEDDGDPMDGWSTPGAPEGSPPNVNDWIVGTVDDGPPTAGEIAAGSLARQGEIIGFLSSVFGRYPWSAAGGIVDDTPLGFALENQTRPIYSRGFFVDSIFGDGVVVHELAHQWYGDSLAVESWQHIWLNEGFATYAEWLWSEREGLGTVQEIFEDFVSIPADDPFWSLTIGDPGPDQMFDIAVYWRGAMTLQALRLEVGDADFFRILRLWATQQAGGNVSTDEFIALAEHISRVRARRTIPDLAVHTGEAGRVRRGGTRADQRWARPASRVDGRQAVAVRAGSTPLASQPSHGC